ncbi:uncharacterized protein LY89DRAFT_78702 [Mollisia scopiformis]|uniref:Uncharacterized protein n=1 Tax=Mollisia scopiformis TaxID=149040 RepID=A0A194X7X8_MOLSC|nr:uncharacterized protein LY89DRAFT_78702 [Mollisia scopiformis]KUJ16271.1 hypothetical protein LY89DRAFT_78702 [Mollisia scopiformis]
MISALLKAVVLFNLVFMIAAFKLSERNKLYPVMNTSSKAVLAKDSLAIEARSATCCPKGDPRGMPTRADALAAMDWLTKPGLNCGISRGETRVGCLNSAAIIVTNPGANTLNIPCGVISSVVSDLATQCASTLGEDTICGVSHQAYDGNSFVVVVITDPKPC